MIPQRTLLRMAPFAFFFAIPACSTTEPVADNVLVTHDIRNLVSPTEFLPPDKGVPTAKLEPSTPRPRGELKEKFAYVRLDALVSNIKSATDPTYWGGDSGASIDSVEGGYLLVKANPSMQRHVTAFLEDLDRISTGDNPKGAGMDKKKK